MIYDHPVVDGHDMFNRKKNENHVSYLTTKNGCFLFIAAIIFFLVIINVIIIIIIITFRIIKFFLFRMEEKLIKNQIKYKNHPKPRKNQIINNNKKNTEKKIVNNNIFHTCWFVCCHNQFELKIQTKKNKIS